MNLFYQYKIKENYFSFIEENGYITKILINEPLLNPINYIHKKSKTIDFTYLQLKEFLAGNRKEFNIPIKLKGTDFQKSVWNALLNTSYGETKSYKDIAMEINNPKAVQAVGTAIGKNPIPIIIPCHRIIKSNGNIGEFRYGIDMKKELLYLEKINRYRTI